MKILVNDTEPHFLLLALSGASGDHVYTHTYPAVEEDFASTDASRLDSWVFTQVKVFFLFYFNKYVLIGLLIIFD